MIEDIVKRFDPLPVKSKLIIFGGGFSGQHLASACKALGNKVLCSRRQEKSKGADFIFDSKNEELSKKILEDATHVLSCIPPSAEGKDPLLQKVKSQLLNAKNLKWIGYLSTTGVYGDSQGAWVNEKTTPKPKQPRSIRRLSCEKEWLETGLPLQILRLPGIYGPGRSAFESLLIGKNKMIDKPSQVFSRIHVDDIAGAILFLIDLASQGNRQTIINVADNLPTNNMEVLSYAATLVGKTLPKIEPFESASKSMSPIALSFWQENRRVSNELLCNELGYNLIHPDFRFGMKDCFKQLKMN